MNKLKKENEIPHIESIVSDILNGYGINRVGTKVDEFTAMGLITPGTFVGAGKYRYSLTPEGKELHESIMMEKLK
jgi:hypothetical protein